MYMSFPQLSISRSVTLLLILSAQVFLCPVAAQQSAATSNRNLEIAARFAPIFFQALGDKPRSDYITNFDFDNDWRGDNNWEHADQKEFPLKAFVYYSVVETATHFFIHYAVFHARDYKGGERKGTILSDLIREGARRGGRYDPTGLADEAALAHENDMEGCLIVVKKSGNNLNEARVAFVETLHHNNFSRYIPGEAANGFSPAIVEDQRVLLYIEPKGHGIEAFTGNENQTEKKEFFRYVYSGEPATQSEETPSCDQLNTRPCTSKVGYALVPISTTLWAKARKAESDTYGETCDYSSISISLVTKGTNVAQRKINVGKVGCAFLGKVGGHNMARPPWGWFDKDERNRPLGRWFFDPAATVKQDFGLKDSFAIAYLSQPFWAR